MRISIELDGSFWVIPEFFGIMGNALKEEGHEVGILTAHSSEIEEEDRKLLLARADFEPSFFYCRDKEDMEMDMIQWKAGMIALKSIDVHFDHDATSLKYNVRIPVIMSIQQEPFQYSKFE